MTAFEFGYAVGNLEKQAVNFTLAGNLPAVIAGQGAKGAPFRTAARQTLEAGKRLAGMAGQGVKTLGGNIAQALPKNNDLYATLGAAGALGSVAAGTGGRVEGAGRGMGYGAGATLGGSVGAGVGNTVANALPAKYRVPAQLVGGLGGTALGLMGARKMMGAPSYAGKEAGVVGDTEPKQQQKIANVGEQLLSAVIRGNPLAHAGVGAAGYAPIGAALGAYNAPSGQKLRGAGRGALTGAATGAGIGAGGALGLKAVGGLEAEIARGLAGGAKNHLINQLPNVGALAGGVAGYQLAKQRPAAKQAGVVGDTAQAMVDKTKQMAGKATATAKTVANKTVDAGKKMQTNFENWRKSK